MLGPGDLRLSLSHPSARPAGYSPATAFLAAVERLVVVSQESRKPLMTVTFKMDGDDAWLANFRLLVMSADFLNVVEGQQRGLSAVKRRVEDMARRGKSKREPLFSTA